MKAFGTKICCLALAWCLGFPFALQAHEFIIKANQPPVERGAKLPFSVLSTHVFMTGEEMLPVKSVKVRLLDGAGGKSDGSGKQGL